MPNEPWLKYTEPAAEGPWAKYKETAGEGPWTKFERVEEPKSYLQTAKEYLQAPVQRLGEAAIGAVKGTAKSLYEGYPESFVDFTPEQVGKIKQSTEFLRDYPIAQHAVAGAVATPYAIGNALGRGAELLTKGAAGGLVGGYAGGAGITDPSQIRQMTGTAERELAGLLESEGGRVPENVHPSGRLAQAKKPVAAERLALQKPEMLALPKPEKAPWERYAEPEQPGAAALPKIEEPLALPKPEEPFDLTAQTRVEPEIEGKSAGAAWSPPQGLPARPAKEYVTKIEDDLHRLQTTAEADKIEMLESIKAMPEELKNPDIQKKLYAYAEGDPLVVLNPAEKQLYDTYIVPLRKMEADEYGWRMQNWDPGIEGFDPQYMHRVLEGPSSRLSSYAGGSTGADPFRGGPSVSKTSASAFKDRTYYTLEDAATGQRDLVSIKGGDIALMTPAGPQPLRGAKLPDDIKIGETVTVQGRPLTIQNALTREIETISPDKYHKNAVANIVDNILEMRAANRAMALTTALKNSPEFAAYSRPYGTRNIPDNWREPNMPTFRGVRVDPKLANALDDFYRNIGGFERLAIAVNRAVTGTLFWSPVVHALNAGYHWYTARGWDWLKPQGMKSLAVDSANAIKEVVTLGPKYRQLLKEGNSLLYAGVKNEDFYKVMLQNIGDDIKRNPAKWDPIARMFGYGPSDLIKALYRGSSKALWSASDMFMMQRVLELERKGLPTWKAIQEAEKHIPNYRVPSEVLGNVLGETGGRVFKQAITHPGLFVFTPYHYGMMKSHMHIMKDLIKGSGKEKFEALGQALATVSLMTIVAPLVNGAIQLATGDKDIELGPKGSTSLPSHLLEMFHGDKMPFEVVASILTPASATKSAAEMFTNTDFFTGKKIVEPGDISKGNLLRAGGQFAERALQTAMQPYATVAQSQRGDKSLGKSFALQALGMRERDAQWRSKKAYGKMRQTIDAAKRRVKPRGPIESLVQMWERR